MKIKQVAPKKQETRAGEKAMNIKKKKAPAEQNGESVQTVTTPAQPQPATVPHGTTAGGAATSTATVERDKHLWEILVPFADNKDIPFTDDHHNSFRRILRSVSGGTTRNPVADGDWVHKGRPFKERMIPMRFRACRADAERFGEHARKFYDQIAIMAYKVADASDIILI